MYEEVSVKFADLWIIELTKFNVTSNASGERFGDKGWEGMGVLKFKIYGVEHSGYITIQVYAPISPLYAWLRSDDMAFCSAQRLNV